MNPVEQVVEALRECADDLEAHVNAAYFDRNQYPDYQRKWKRDMDIVVRARAALAEIQRWDAVRVNAAPFTEQKQDGRWTCWEQYADCPANAILLVRKESDNG